ncbi:MAG: type II CAAX endopeptidase family protein [Anaerococcus hydrogenalis]|uniref:CPBP family intramembrane glutamic endopeptidase n=1 Tax=Anaerococcus hydrogenalis TaxID=33029 RepID=UPI00290701C2|nr:type II CAAX endopeptidase family protein [Anaerococcus hydrogenalis]MDU3688061.1 type II CAAX endopeptidase family protein [Anaerococcus hydrogenalis]
MMKNKKSLFVNCLIPVLILIISQIISQEFAKILNKIIKFEFISNVFSGILYVTICYFLLQLFSEKKLNKKIESFNIKIEKINLYWFILAILLPTVVVIVYLLLFDGNFVENPSLINSKLQIISSGIFYTGLGAGIVEEMVFRGFILNLLKEKYNIKIAIILPSLIFGLLHIIGIPFNILTYMQIIFAGTLVEIMFSLISIKENNILSSSLVHSFWNIFIIGGILNIGTEFNKYSIYNYILKNKNILFTGGEFGIEISIISIVSYMIVIYLVFKSLKK